MTYAEFFRAIIERLKTFITKDGLTPAQKEFLILLISNAEINLEKESKYKTIPRKEIYDQVGLGYAGEIFEFTEWYNLEIIAPTIKKTGTCSFTLISKNKNEEVLTFGCKFDRLNPQKTKPLNPKDFENFFQNLMLKPTSIVRYSFN